MKAKAKDNSSALVGILVFIAVMLIFISIPFVSYAQTGTLGTASPEVYCTYEKDGEQFDGDNLPAGTYDVSFVLSGLTDTSVFQITATYDTEQVTVAEQPSALLSDGENSQFDSIGYKLSDGNIVFGFISTNADCSAVNEDGQIIATVSMTFAADCDPDADNLIVVSENPNHTFAQSDYGDGFKDEYAVVDDGVSSVEGYDGTLYSMKCDVTPSTGHSVTANLVVMTNPYGATSGKTVNGEYTVNVYSDSERSQFVTSVTSSMVVSDDGTAVNQFVIPGLKNGITYYVTISSAYSLTRSDITINMGAEDMGIYEIPVIACDFAGSDQMINVNDIGGISVSAGAGTSDKVFDLNSDDLININDIAIVRLCASDTPNYPAIVIE